MYEVDFIPVGEGERSGDAIAMRFTHPDTSEIAVVVIDAGFADSGEALVNHIQTYYGTDRVDLVISTHPDLDHIGGLGVVLRNLAIRELWIHRPGLHGYRHNSGHKPAEELTALAETQGATVREPFAGLNSFGQALAVAGPTQEFYEEMLGAQDLTSKAAPASFAGRLAEATRKTVRSFLDSVPAETFFDDAGGTNPRNNSSAILDLQLGDERFFFPADGGVPAINAAQDALESWGRGMSPPQFLQMPHHGSRHNLDRDTADRILGGIGQIPPVKSAVVNVAPNSTAPSARVNNALMRRGYNTYETRGKAICHYGDGAPPRAGWTPLTPMPPMDETEEEGRDSGWARSAAA